MQAHVKENKYNRGTSKTPIENSFYSYAELTEEQKIRFAAYQVFDMPKKASSNSKDTDNKVTKD